VLFEYAVAVGRRKYRILPIYATGSERYKNYMDFETKVDLYLKERFGPGAELKGMERRGKGTHGTGYLLTFTLPGEERQVVMKSLSPSGFGHDHYSDRAQVLLLAHSNYNEMDKHIKALDVVGDSSDRFTSLKEAREFYIFMEKASGTDYFKDLDVVLEQGRLYPEDRKKARRLACFLAGIHQKKYTGEEAKTLYRRRIRDLIGHGECIMGIIDAYNGADFTSDEELVGYVKKSLPWWEKIRNRAKRLCEVHGDFHPGNIWFQDHDFVLLDRARGKRRVGCPAIAHGDGGCRPQAGRVACPTKGIASTPAG